VDKSKGIVKIGIAPYLAALLAELPKRGEFILPGMAAEYMAGQKSAISNRVMKFFERYGIETRQQGTGSRYYYAGKRKLYVPDRPRAIVINGFHSLRYSYISHNAEAGTPAAIIQRNAGHSNPAMTEHYTRISDAAAVKYAKVLDISEPTSAADVIIEAPPAGDTATSRQQLHRITDALSEEQTNELLAKMK
jgi:integrase